MDKNSNFFSDSGWLETPEGVKVTAEQLLFGRAAPALDV